MLIRFCRWMWEGLLGFHWHEWGQWQIIEGEVTSTLGSKYSADFNVRRCKTCNKLHSEKI